MGPILLAGCVITRQTGMIMKYRLYYTSNSI